MKRIPITREDADGTITDGTAEVSEKDGHPSIHDFRDLNGEPLSLPPLSRFVFSVGLAFDILEEDE